MNIIKLKDVVMQNTCSFYNFFNEKLKGKYAYWIKMRYIFPLEDVDNRTYMQLEQMDESEFANIDLAFIDLYSEECCMFNFAQNYVDHDATELANNVNDYYTANAYVADYDIDITKLRRFRTWLAEEILKYSTSISGEYLNNLTPNQIHMFEFYKNNMYNEIVKQLSIFGEENSFTAVEKSGCGCCTTTSLYNLSNVNTCNALNIYIKNIHNLMVQTFENVNFWTQFNRDFIGVFKRYIDNIIKTGLIINSNSNRINIYTQCECNDVNSTKNILKNLSDALGYIMEGDIHTHNNFIYDSLHTWAESLYDYMYWEIK